MTLKSTSCVAALAAALLLPSMAMPGAALAQTQTPDAAPAATAKPMGGGMMAGHAMLARHGKAGVSAADRVEQHITQLHAQLRITAAQQAPWDQFAEVMRDNAKDMDHLLDQRQAGFASMNAVDNMQSYAQIAQQHAQDTQKLATAFQALYGSLSDEQKKNADVVFRAHDDHPRHAHG